MKLLNKDQSRLIIEFNHNELEVLNRVIEVPLSAFGLNELLVKTGLSLEKVKTIKQNIESALAESLHILAIEKIDIDN